MNQPVRTPSWLNYTAEELEFHYNPRVATPGVDSYNDARGTINEQGLAWPGRIGDIAYGADALMTLDLYPPARATTNCPVHFYIHGGYWRSREKEDFAFIGAALADAGLLTAVINYPLCPRVSLAGVVAGTRAAFQWVHENITEYGGNRDAITVSGHSAGGHLGAAIIAHDWASQNLPASPLAGAVLLSGIYDPTPAQHISVNAELNLTPEIARRYNYLDHAPRARCPVHVLVGGDEPAGWIAQSADYAAHVEANGLTVRFKASTGENHFSILDQYRDPGSHARKAIQEIAGL